MEINKVLKNWKIWLMWEWDKVVDWITEIIDWYENKISELEKEIEELNIIINRG